MSDAVETRTQREPVCKWDTGEQNKKIDKHLLHCVVYSFLWQNELGSEYTAMVLLLLLLSAVRYKLMNC